MSVCVHHMASRTCSSSHIPIFIYYTQPIIEWMQWVLSHLLDLLLNAERYSFSFFFTPLNLDLPTGMLSLSPPANLIAVALSLWDPRGMLAETLVWLADSKWGGSLARQIFGWLLCFSAWQARPMTWAALSLMERLALLYNLVIQGLPVWLELAHHLEYWMNECIIYT